MQDHLDDLGDPQDLLGPLLPRFDQLGLSDIAQRLRAVLGETPEAESESRTSPTRREIPPDLSPADLASLSEAAAALGLRSVNTVLVLVDTGRLEGFAAAHGEGAEGGLMVSRRSIASYLESPSLATQRRVEEQLWAMLSGADAAEG
jgi:hypothetical protein